MSHELRYVNGKAIDKACEHIGCFMVVSKKNYALHIKRTHHHDDPFVAHVCKGCGVVALEMAIDTITRNLNAGANSEADAPLYPLNSEVNVLFAPANDHEHELFGTWWDATVVDYNAVTMLYTVFIRRRKDQEKDTLGVEFITKGNHLTLERDEIVHGGYVIYKPARGGAFRAGAIQTHKGDEAVSKTPAGNDKCMITVELLPTINDTNDEVKLVRCTINCCARLHISRQQLMSTGCFQL
ncbi:hypothetical protein SAMD00019534_056000 [Acytostelium subglobosum LB1]|uniref:hypothetical protein n=1 Tax=Acytostelium subglobosum LB1 TaxID=1410327 RepID=UPI0006450C63|nr:hypothetical protein SAMD00019534_056000 [Acytostelium subglobosum LB1]GAM22425.1 hypothetical protein SAMD00019534_056000 [Acytostelium subglobosum LB1]|eukprot:XP_012754545.1 hypothetical protein SAMD00019534_056000 [Acytostelium subglobosum LB1]